MKVWSLAAVMALAVACGGNDRDTGRAGDGAMGGTTGATGTAGEGAGAGTAADADLGMMDRNFLEDQLQDGMKEVQLGKLAQERAASAEVREFGAMMVRDHTQAGEQLKQVAGRFNVKHDGEHGDDHADMQERLTKLSGAEFDRAYINAMVDDHEEAVNEVQARVDSDNPEVKKLATAMLPVLQKHQERAKELQQRLENTQGRTRGQNPDRK